MSPGSKALKPASQSLSPNWFLFLVKHWCSELEQSTLETLHTSAQPPVTRCFSFYCSPCSSDKQHYLCSYILSTSTSISSSLPLLFLLLWYDSLQCPIGQRACCINIQHTWGALHWPLMAESGSMKGGIRRWSSCAQLQAYTRFYKTQIIRRFQWKPSRPHFQSGC